MQQDLASIVLMGHQLDRAAAQKLELNLTSSPDNWDERMRLIGYYYKHYYCCEDAGKRRIDHIIWLIRTQPDFKPLLMSYLHTHILDRRGYASIKAAFQAAINRNPMNVSIYANMASFVQFQEPEFAEELYQKALQIDATNSAVISRLEKLRNSMEMLRENRDSYQKSGDSYFIPGAVGCPEKTGQSAGGLKNKI